MFSSQLDSGAFASSQSTQNPDSSSSKNRGATPRPPVTLKRLIEAYQSSDDKSSVVVDGINATNFRIVGLVMNKRERATDVTFTIDDGTGRMDFLRWVNDASDTNETAIIQNGMYVNVIGSITGFQERKRASAFSVRPVIDYNQVALHFIECIYMHLKNAKSEVGSSASTSSTLVTGTPLSNGLKELHSQVSNQVSGQSGVSGSETDIYKLVLDVFQEPASLANEHGLHVDEVVRRLGLPSNKIKEAIDYHVDVGHIYSTIDDYHFKSALID
ncbi:replication protein A 32 kDa subunit A-like [Ananas comosus]|uniref:Replication protein A 32 kDa subunit A-like n=1 Tax=Ananas comosus TaxID=4615 RepID=A0A6P5H748_ANACO|nr:replication protein A 32 kDa subunit A-like [Ananas comosus]